MRSCIMSIAAFLLIAAAHGSGVEAQEAPAQALEWNVFLSHWQLLGPFPKEDPESTGLDTPFVTDEAGLRAGQVSFYKNKLYTWKPYDERVINFRKAFKVQGSSEENVVAY